MLSTALQFTQQGKSKQNFGNTPSSVSVPTLLNVLRTKSTMSIHKYIITIIITKITLQHFSFKQQRFWNISGIIVKNIAKIISMNTGWLWNWQIIQTLLDKITNKLAAHSIHVNVSGKEHISNTKHTDWQSNSKQI